MDPARDPSKPIKKSRSVFDKIFLEHPREAGETYGQHLLFTLEVAGYLVLTAGCAVMHGLFPLTFTTTTSDRIHALSKKMQERKAHYLRAKENS